MVRVLVPTLAEELAVSVSVLIPVAGLGEKEAVTPLGSPDTARFTLPVNPYWGLTPMYGVVELPWPMFAIPGLESVKLGACTPKVRLVVVVRLPEVPVMVRVFVAALAELLAVSVSTLLPEVGFVPHTAVTPLGSPDTARFTIPLNPYCGVTVIVEVAVLPWFSPTMFGEADRRNPGAWT